MPERIRIADALEEARKVANDGVIRSNALSRKKREMLERGGWLRRIVRGWYLLQQPSDPKGSTTAWYASFWTFTSLYLGERHGERYCLSAESSLDLHLGATLIPQQVIVMAAKGGSTLIQLPENTSILAYEQRDNLPEANETEKVNGVRVMSLALALARVSPSFFTKQPQDAEIALRLLKDPTELIRILISGTRYISASERLAGAYRFLLQHEYAERIQTAMETIGQSIEPKNPFKITEPFLELKSRLHSPYAGRVKALWKTLREDVEECFSLPQQPTPGIRQMLKRIQATQVDDAYHSLSIEGYQVTPDLIRRVREGTWDADLESNRNERSALAARGYYEASKKVEDVIRSINKGESAAPAVTHSIQKWYAALFAPSVAVGLLTPSDLAGYRNGPVYLRGAKHVPPPREALIDAMDAFAECMSEETSPIVRAILGHFLFVWIHPFPDGNGRLARFIMNTMLVTGGYPWTIIRVENRARYMEALDAASTQGDIKPFVNYVAEEAKRSLKRWEEEID